jgi:hypothetical protein
VLPVPVASVFDPQSSKNVAVYYGQPGSVGGTSRLQMCADPNMSIVILGFLTDLPYGGSNYPQLQLVRTHPSRPFTTLSTYGNSNPQNPSISNIQTSQMQQLAPGLSYYRPSSPTSRSARHSTARRSSSALAGQGTRSRSSPTRRPSPSPTRSGRCLAGQRGLTRASGLLAPPFWTVST